MLNPRPAAPSDLPRVVAIYNASIPAKRSTADLTPVSDESKSDWFFAHSDTRPLFVYEWNEQVIGWGSLENYNSRPAYHKTVELSFYIDTPYHRQGFGTQILDHLLRQVPRVGGNRAIAVIYRHNHASRELLTRAGFRRWGLLPGVCEIEGEDYDVEILGWHHREYTPG